MEGAALWMPPVPQEMKAHPQMGGHGVTGEPRGEDGRAGWHGGAWRDNGGNGGGDVTLFPSGFLLRVHPIHQSEDGPVIYVSETYCPSHLLLAPLLWVGPP